MSEALISEWLNMAFGGSQQGRKVLEIWMRKALLAVRHLDE